MAEPARHQKAILLLFALPWLLLGLWQISQSYDTLAEDAWIHFRYARNLGEGHGLVSNPGGSHEEGYSSLVSILLLAPSHALGISLPFAERLIGILGSLGLILLLRRWLNQVPGPVENSAWLMLVAGLGILASSDLVSWSTAGLPTTEYAWLILLMAYVLWRTLHNATRGRGMLLGALGFVCLNARPEGAMYAPMAFALLYGVHRVERGSNRAWLASMGPGLLLFVFLTIALALWKLSYFGDLLSNPSYVKLAVRPWMEPLAYFQRYFTEHGLLLLLLYGSALLFAAQQVLGAFRARRFEPRSLAVLVLAAFLAAQCFYIWYVRGDYMAGFRFFVPTHAFLVGLLLLLSLQITERFPVLAASEHLRGVFLLFFPVLPLFLTCFDLPARQGLPISSGMIDKSSLVPYQDGLSRMYRELETRDGPYALSEFGFVAYHLPHEGIDIMGLNQHQVARCYKRYPLGEAVFAARDYVLSRNPSLISTYGYWKDAAGKIHCKPSTAWFFLPYLHSPYFQNQYETRFPKAGDDRLRFSIRRPDAQMVNRIDRDSGADLDRLLHGFFVESDKIWVGPIARILLDPSHGDRRIVLEGYQPALDAYAQQSNRIEIAIDGDTVGDRMLFRRELQQTGRFRFEIELPANVTDESSLLLSLFGEAKNHPVGSSDQRKLSWILERIELSK